MTAAFRLFLFQFLLILTIVSLYGQPRGVTQLSSTALDSGRNGEVYALVVGISDYQDPSIPDLRFADRDAEAFANFLKSDAGGRLAGDHLKLLTNKNATGAQIIMALDWLLDVSKENDRVIIYFSGHGDVDSKLLETPGYLLGWDAPVRVYDIGGTLSLSVLQGRVSTLSVKNKAKVVLIADACHSGKLSGNEINGAQLTGQYLARQFKNEVKILSCQPNEYSIEGEQWGGGRGVFSFYLLKGLYGLADANKDSKISLKEINQFLQDRVSNEVAPIDQNPQVIGDLKEVLSVVDTSILLAAQFKDSGQIALLSPIDSRGIEKSVLQLVDSSVQKTYELFIRALKEKTLFEPEGQCAEVYYEKLMAEPGLRELHSMMRRNYAAALQDDAQQVLNKWLKTDLSELKLSKRSKLEKYTPYLRYLKRASEILGKEHYMYPLLQARIHFFEGYLMNLSGIQSDRSLGRKALLEFQQALKWQKDLPHVYLEMSKVYAYQFLNADSAEYYVKKAMYIQPKWVLPYTDLAFMFLDRFKSLKRAKPYLEKAIRLDSNSVEVYSTWGAYFLYSEDFAKAEEVYKKIIRMDPNNSIAYANLGIVYMKTGRLVEAENAYLKSIQLDSSHAFTSNNLGIIYYETYRFPEAEEAFKSAITKDPGSAVAYYNLGNVQNRTSRMPEAEQSMKSALRLDSSFAKAYYSLGWLYQHSGQVPEAEKMFQLASKLDSTMFLSSKKSQESFEDRLWRVADPSDAQMEMQVQIRDTIIAPPEMEVLIVKSSGPDFSKENGKVKVYRPEESYDLAVLHIHEGDLDKAYTFLEQAIVAGYGNYNDLQKDSNLAEMRKLKKKWKGLMKKYFDKNQNRSTQSR